MPLETKKYLYDIQQAAERLTQFSRGKTFSDYSKDAMLRSAIERQFEIIGEALSHLSKIDPACISKISAYQRIIAFRNILIHGYAEIDDRLVGGVLEARLPTLYKEVSLLLLKQDEE